MGQTAPRAKQRSVLMSPLKVPISAGTSVEGVGRRWRRQRRRIGNPHLVARPTAAAPDGSLVESNLTLVEQIVVQVAVNFPRHVDRGELVRAGVLGLVEAANRFDASKGVPFDKFAGAADPWRRSSTRCARPTGRLARCGPWPARPTPPSSGSPAGSGGCPRWRSWRVRSGQRPLTWPALRDRVFRSVVLALDYRLGEATTKTCPSWTCSVIAPSPSRPRSWRRVRCGHISVMRCTCFPSVTAS